MRWQFGTKTALFTTALRHLTYSYDPGGDFEIDTAIDSDGTRTRCIYPSTKSVDEDRESSGRLTRVKSDGVIIWETTAGNYKGAELPGNTSIGGVIRELNDYDGRKRLLRRRYERTPGGTLLAEMRFKYDAADNLLARQFLHRNGRADVFAYDDASRLLRAEVGTRPGFSGTVRISPGLQGGENFEPGLFARDYGYDGGGLDLLLGGGPPVNPDSLPEQGQAGIPSSGLVMPAFARSLRNHDSYLHAPLLDGVNRGGTDELGNVRSTALLVRRDGEADPQQKRATKIEYNAFNQLAHIELEDGRTIDYEYLPEGLMHHRVVKQSTTTLSDRVYVWDQGRLIEEYEVGSNNPVGRYYYADSDWPVAADLPDANGQLQRRYYLCDNVYSVVAVANDSGDVIERVTYDPWGQPAIEKRDTLAPRVAHVFAESGGALLFEFSETVLPPINAAGSGLVTSAGTLQNPFTLTAGGQTVSGTVEYFEDAPNARFGSVLRFTPSGTLSGTVDVQVQPDKLFDEWGNGNAADGFSFPITGSPGLVFTGPNTDTAPQHSARSDIGNPFLFHGQFFDYEAGLVYMRARFYDPFTGQFLQRDPMQYEDSVNLYAAFAQNPVGKRDPTGRSLLTWLIRFFKGLGRPAIREVEAGAVQAGVHTLPRPSGQMVSRPSISVAGGGGVRALPSADIIGEVTKEFTHPGVRPPRTPNEGLLEGGDDVLHIVMGEHAIDSFGNASLEMLRVRPNTPIRAAYVRAGASVEELTEALAGQAGKKFRKVALYAHGDRASGRLVAGAGEGKNYVSSSFSADDIYGALIQNKIRFSETDIMACKAMIGPAGGRSFAHEWRFLTGVRTRASEDFLKLRRSRYTTNPRRSHDPQFRGGESRFFPEGFNSLDQDFGSTRVMNVIPLD